MRIQSEVQFPAIHSFSERIGAVYRYGILMGYHFGGAASRPIWVGYLCLLVLGTVRLSRGSLRELSGGLFGRNTMASIWTATTFITVGSKVHMQWPRYFLPLVMCVTLLLALGMDAVLDFAIGRAKAVVLRRKEALGRRSYLRLFRMTGGGGR
jgi:hypothetical protein